MEAPVPPQAAEEEAQRRSGSGSEGGDAGLTDSAPTPPPVPRPPAGARVFCDEQPSHLTCAICHDAFKDVRARRGPAARCRGRH
jgi:hypothetical protein